MKLGLFFFGIILIGFLFEFVEHMDARWGTIDLFYLKDDKWNPSSYVYFAGESIAYIALAFIIRGLTPHKRIATAFIVIESIDLIDFFVTKNNPWFELQGWPITFNIIKVVVFVLFLLTMAVYDLSRDVASS